MSEEHSHEIQAVDVTDGLPDEDVPPATIRSGLASDEDIVRSHAAKVAAQFAADDPDRVLELTPALVDAIEDDHPVVLFQSCMALQYVAEEHPERVTDAVPRLVELQGHDLVDVRKIAVRTLGYVAEERPAALTDHVEALLLATADRPEELFDADELAEHDRNQHDEGALWKVNRENEIQQTLSRELSANLLVDVANADPGSVAPHVPQLVELVDDADLGVARPAAAMLATVAEHDPGAAAGAVDTLRDLLEEDDTTLVANAVVALGHLGASEAAADVRAVAEDENREEDLRELAAETAAFLDQ